MFTSRAEFRLLLRPDNADMRLTELGHTVGAVSMERYARFQSVKKRFEECQRSLESVRHSIERWNRILGTEISSGEPLTAYQVLTRHPVKLAQLAVVMPDKRLDAFCDLDASDVADLENRLKIEGLYAHMHTLLAERIEEMRQASSTLLPFDASDYARMQELKLECREKLAEFCPSNMAAAARIPGITPESLINLLRHIRQRQREKSKEKQSEDTEKQQHPSSAETPSLTMMMR